MQNAPAVKIQANNANNETPQPHEANQEPFDNLPYHEKRMLRTLGIFYAWQNASEYIEVLNDCLRSHIYQTETDGCTLRETRDHIFTVTRITEFLTALQEDFKSHERLELKPKGIEVPYF
jgi:hypothetical protein